MPARQLNQSAPEDSHAKHRFISNCGLLLFAAWQQHKEAELTRTSRRLSTNILPSKAKPARCSTAKFPLDLPEKRTEGTIWDRAKAGSAGTGGAAARERHNSGGSRDARCLQGPTPPQPVKHYELTAEGGKYFQELTGGFGGHPVLAMDGSRSFHRQVDGADDDGSTLRPRSRYTYKIAYLATWAERSGGSAVRSPTFNGDSGTIEGNSDRRTTVDEQGWEIPAHEHKGA